MKPIARKDELVIQEVGGEVLVYDLRSNKAICLNQTSALVWKNCDGNKDALEIAKNIEKQLGSSVNEDLVWFAVNQLKKEDLLDNKEDAGEKFEGLSRREVVKKIGLSSLIALPIIASLAAPTAAQTATCIAQTCTCTVSGMNGGSCASTTCGTAPCLCRNLTGCNPGGQNCTGTCATA